jgi:hypothetical protein
MITLLTYIAGILMGMLVAEKFTKLIEEYNRPLHLLSCIICTVLVIHAFIF